MTRLATRAPSGDGKGHNEQRQLTGDKACLYVGVFLSSTFQLKGGFATDLYVEGGFEFDHVVELQLMKMF